MWEDHAVEDWLLADNTNIYTSEKILVNNLIYLDETKDEQSAFELLNYESKNTTIINDLSIIDDLSSIHDSFRFLNNILSQKFIYPHYFQKPKKTKKTKREKWIENHERLERLKRLTSHESHESHESHGSHERLEEIIRIEESKKREADTIILPLNSNGTIDNSGFDHSKRYKPSNFI